jgi:CheY-like chemotaxis protein
MLSHNFIVLVAEDDPNDLELLRMAASKEGVKVSIRHVHDGQEAIDYLQGKEPFGDRDTYPFPDLVVLDLKMPRVNGLDVLDWLRKHPDCGRLPTVMLSGSGIATDIEDAYRRGVNTYFTKPGNFEQYRKLARVMLDYWCQSQRPHVQTCH